MKNPHYTHKFECEFCLKKTIKKTKDKNPQKYCSSSCSQKSRIGKKINDSKKKEKAIKSFEKNVIRKEDCWGWKGKLIQGYGYISTKYFGSQRAHRISYIIHKGEIPKGLHILHSCHNRSCTNPNHLRAGTQKENMQDKCDSLRQHFKIEKNKIIAIRLVMDSLIFTEEEIAKIFKIRKTCIKAIKDCVI